jgi:predicted DNA-binding WGR domain protein
MGNNKFYILQLVDMNGKGTNGFGLFSTWGRIGIEANGLARVFHPGSLAVSKAAFEKKYKEKTGNDWENRKNFVKRPGKYFPIDTVYADDEPVAQVVNAPPSNLHPKVQALIKLIFDVEMISKTLLSMGFDTRKMPLGKLSANQIQAGWNVLRQLDQQVKAAEPNSFQLSQLSNQFYTVIPHDFGQNIPQSSNRLSS